MATYRIFLRIRDKPTDIITDVVCDNDQEACELAQRMLGYEGGRGRRAEVRADRRFVAAIVAARVLKWRAAEHSAHGVGAT
jgi:hypothetical protein